ncbi:MAG TPA: hypothetical protein VN632_03505 [Stellaceae bacterium]|nr:hypothetical protein [Stellaceae bacterium]
MAIRKRTDSSFVAFDIVYEDGTRSSNRRVPASVLGGLDGDEPAKAILEAQDRDIGVASGRARGPIKSIARSSR